MELTKAQQRVYQYIQDFIAEYRVPPTRAEIAAGLGFRSVNAAVDHLKTLERKGYIQIWRGSSRGIQLTQEPVGLPVVGRVAVGGPIVADDNIESYLDLDPTIYEPRADYFLRMRGHGMRDAGILNGDLLAVHGTTKARTGQVVVVRLDNRAQRAELASAGTAVEAAKAQADETCLTCSSLCWMSGKASSDQFSKRWASIARNCTPSARERWTGFRK